MSLHKLAKTKTNKHTELKMISSVSAQQKSDTFFDLQTGMIKPHFKRQLDIVGVVVKPHFPELDPYHILNVDNTLQTNGCFQNDCDLYKKGNVSKFTINYAQAKAILDEDYKNQEIILPREKVKSTAIFPGGVEPTLHKRFNSLIKSIENGYEFSAIQFVVPNEKIAENLSTLISGKYKSILKDMVVNVHVVNLEKNWFEQGLQTLSNENKVGDQYVIITDPTFVSKVELIATSALPKRKCLGIASVPVQSWVEDMNLYDYEAKLNDLELYGYKAKSNSHEKAAIAWASSAWNFKARQVNTELKAYKAAQISK